jgi:TRAP-type mannitol/chloroaromatic compound transport system substrate-binding protein
MAIAKAEALQGPMLTKFEKEGVKLVRWSDEILAGFKKATDEVMAEESAKDALFKKVYESQNAFQAAHQPWRQYGFLPR